MNYKTIPYEQLGETLYEYRHESGLPVVFLKKAGYNKKTAMFATDYGSINNQFKVQGSGKELSVPDGIAHFLEHKLFEQEDGNMLERFSRMGSSPNAFTAFSQTVYYFSCTERFDENFAMLLDYVQKPWLTDENVEKEKGIINQEIRMYQDNPDWRVFFNMLDCLYVSHPVKLDIAGSVESVAQITKELLYDCYNTFYTPSNMMVLVVGDLDPDQVFRIVDKNIFFKDGAKVEKRYPEEPEEPAKTYKEQRLPVSMPLFSMGIKDSVRVTGYELQKRRTGLGILMDYVMGKSSDLYGQLYDEGLINDTFRYEVSLDKSFGYIACAGQSPEPKKAAERIDKAMKELIEKGMEEEDFVRIQKALQGRFVRTLNSPDGIARDIMDAYFIEGNYFDLNKVYEEIDRNYLKGLAKEVLGKTAVLSVVHP